MVVVDRYANRGITFCLVLLCFKMKMGRSWEESSWKGKAEATGEQEDHCQWWKQRSTGQEERIPPNVLHIRTARQDRILLRLVIYLFIYLFSFLLNLWGWHWLTKLYRFYHNSTTHHLYTVLWGSQHQVKSHHHLSPAIPSSTSDHYPSPQHSHHTVVIIILENERKADLK